MNRKGVELTHVLLEQKSFPGIELTQIEIKSLPGKSVIKRLMTEMLRRELLAEDQCNELVAVIIKDLLWSFPGQASAAQAQQQGTTVKNDAKISEKQALGARGHGRRKS
jgi:hypothetical protein